jgi:DNA-binding Lrp family transcriptional regulator
MNLAPNDLHELNILKHVEEDPRLNNRQAAQKLGVSVRLAHTLLKRMVSKGSLHIRVVNSRRWDYFLTSQGIAEKARLTREFLQFSMQFYREARRRSAELCRNLAESGETGVAFLGAGDLAEIAFLGVCEWGLRLDAVCDDGHIGGDFFGSEVTGVEAVQRSSVSAVVVCMYPRDQPMREQYLPAGIHDDGRFHWIF